MLGQTESIQGLLQSRVGAFLQLKAQLLAMIRSPILTISDKANQLMTTQLQLESDLPVTVERSQSENLSDLISVGGFYVLMEKQIHDVGELYDKYISFGSSASTGLIGGIPNWLLYVGGAFILWRIIR